MIEPQDTLLKSLVRNDYQPNSTPHQGEPLDLPVFDISHVLAKNQPIDIDVGEGKPIDTFFNKMSELGYQANNVSQTYFVDDSHENHYQEIPPNPHIKQVIRLELAEDGPAPAEQHSAAERALRGEIRRRIDQIDMQVSSLNFQRFQIVDAVRWFQDEVTLILKHRTAEWESRVAEFAKTVDETGAAYQAKIQSLQKQLCKYVDRCEQLQRQSEFEGNDSIHLKLSVQQLQQANFKLNQQLEQLEVENSELKFQLGRQAEGETTIRQLQDELEQLNRTIDQNSQYIFDLEQRVAGANLEMGEKENALRKQFQASLQEERQLIQKEYRSQFQKIQGEIKNKMQEQIGSQLHVDIQIQHEREIQDLRTAHQEAIKQLELQNMNLLNANREYEQKIHQIEQQMEANKKKSAEQKPKILQYPKIQLPQLNISQTSLQHKLKEKQVELNYYKSLVTKREQYSILPAKVNPNILVLQEYSHSFSKQTAVSPSSSMPNYYQKVSYGGVSSRDDMINNILTRIRLRQGNSMLSNFNDSTLSMQSVEGRRFHQERAKPVSPESVIMEREKDVRMRNISNKLEQLRSDIRKEIGMIRN